MKESYREMTDSELVAAVRDGDGRAFDALFLRWYPQVYRFLRVLLKEDAVAEDLAQSVFVRVWLHRKRLDPAKSLKNYLFVLSRNGAMDVFKSKRYLVEESLERPPEEVSPDHTEYRTEFAETSNRVLRAVEKMPPQRRAVFAMNRYHQLTAEEIAELMGISVRTVEKHLQLALDDLRKFLT